MPNAINFAPLGDLGTDFFQARDAAVKRQKDEDLRALGADLSQKVASGQPIDYKTLGAALFRSGDFASGLGMLKLGQAQEGDKSFVDSLTGAQAAPAGTHSQSAPAGPRAPSFTMPKGAGVSMTNPDDDVDTMARTMAAEAGNQGDQGMAAVAHVIANRAKIAGLNPTQVIERPHQFEAYDNGSADRYDPGNPAYDRARAIAQGVLAGQIPDPTNGATHYLNPDLQAKMGRAQPSWAPGNGTRIGAHVFYSLPQDAAALYGRSAPVQSSQGQVASNDPAILPPPSPGMQRVQDEARAKGIGQTGPVSAPAAPQSGVSLTPRAIQFLRAASSGTLSEGMRESAKLLLKEELERSRPNLDVKEMNGRLLLIDKNSRQVSDVTPKGTPSWRNPTAEERAAYGADEDKIMAIGPNNQPHILGTNSKDSGKEAYDKGVGGDYSDVWKNIHTDARKAPGTMATLRVMDRLIDDPNFYSGTGGETATKVMRAMSSLGLADAKAAAPNELFAKLANRYVIDSQSGSLGSGFSNADRDFVAAANVNANNTPEGNRAIIRMAQKVEERKIEVAKQARQYAAKNGGRLDAGFDQQLADWSEKNPLFPKGDIGLPATQGGPQGAPQFKKGDTATHPKTQERMIFDGQGWVPLQVKPDA